MLEVDELRPLTKLQMEKKLDLVPVDPGGEAPPPPASVLPLGWPDCWGPVEIRGGGGGSEETWVVRSMLFRDSVAIDDNYGRFGALSIMSLAIEEQKGTAR